MAPDPRGWQRYSACLLAALRERPELALRVLSDGWPGPEALFEQVALPLAARGADVLHAPNCFLPLMRPCPGVVTIHDLAFEAFPEDFAPRTRAKFRWLTPRAARSAQAVIVPSAFTRDDVCARYGIDPAKVHVVPEGPALPVGDASPPEGPYLLGVGDLRVKKNWLRLVRAWVSMRTQGLPHRLVIAGGDAGEAARLRAAAGSEPLELPGYVGDARLDALMRGADLLVHPSLYEGFGLVIVEAQSRGTPVAAARATALPETGADVYFDPLDEADIARAIRDGIGRRVEWDGRFSWRRAAEETARVYRQVAA
jgi:glycosyltransferase involved in cell wall biosynthesis